MIENITESYTNYSESITGRMVTYEYDSFSVDDVTSTQNINVSTMVSTTDFESLTTIFTRELTSTIKRASYLHPAVINAYTWGMYIIPIMAIFFNGLSIAVFMQRRFSKASVSSFLIALAICDTLANSMYIYISYMRVGLWPLSAWGCKISVYVTAVGKMSALWLNVLFTAERFISVRYVFKRDRIITPFRIKSAIAILICCIMVEQVFIIVLMDMRPPRFCFVNDPQNETKYLLTLLIMNRIINFIIPLFLVAVMNSMVISTIRKSARITGKYLTNQENNERRLTLMLVMVSTVTFILVIPETTSKILEAMKLHSEAWLVNFSLISDIVSYLSHSCNFFFYVLAGRNFRTALIDMISCGCQKNTGDNETMKYMSGNSLNRTSNTVIREGMSSNDINLTPMSNGESQHICNDIKLTHMTNGESQHM